MERTAFETILYEKEGAIVTITLNRPDAFNSFNFIMNKEITDALRTAEKDSEVRCLVITGAGKAFCAGQDIKNVTAETDYGTLLKDNYHPMVKAFNEMTKPTIAAVNGVAAGAGMSLALAADYRIVKPETKFVSAFTGIGLVPDAGFMYVLPRLIGYAKALEIATIGKPISGKEAVELGLATELAEEAEWEESVQRFAHQFAQMPTKAFSLIKQIMLDSMHTPFNEFLAREVEAQREAGMTEDHQEGLNAFLEKRKPVFKGN